MRQLRAGDKVKVVCPGYFPSCEPIGSTGTLVEIDYEDVLRPYLVKFESGIKQWMEADCIAPIENPNAPMPERKVGDIVRVKSREWYDANKDADGDVMMEGVAFTPSMTDFCSRSFEITQILNNGPVRYHLKGAGPWYYTEGMLEEGYLRVDSDTMSGSIHTTASLEARNICGIGEGNLQISVPLIRQNQLLTNIKLD